jgi:hypothetical protein
MADLEKEGPDGEKGLDDKPPVGGGDPKGGKVPGAFLKKGKKGHGKRHGGKR